MVNKHYAVGRAFEYKVMNFFKNIGAKVLRNAGSHKPDLVIMFPKKINGKNWIVECKKDGRLTKGDKIELEDFKKNYSQDGVFVASPLCGMICLEEI